jgi:hypothetical protein
MVSRRKQMNPPFRYDSPVPHELIERASSPGNDSKSIFALLLRLEREIGSEAKAPIPFSMNERINGNQETAHHDGRSKAHP